MDFLFAAGGGRQVGAAQQPLQPSGLLVGGLGPVRFCGLTSSA